MVRKEMRKSQVVSWSPVAIGKTKEAGKDGGLDRKLTHRGKKGNGVLIFSTPAFAWAEHPQSQLLSDWPNSHRTVD